MRLRSRLMVAFAYLLLLAVVALSIPLGVHVARRARDEFAVRLINHAELIARGAPQAMQDGPDALARLAAEDKSIGRVIVTDARGYLIADSHGQTLGRNFRFRPEIRTALDGHPTRLVRDNRVFGLQYIAAVPVIEDRAVVGAVRINQEVATIDALVRRRLLILAGGALAVLMIALMVAALIARSLTKPLHHLADVASVIGEGDLSARADETGQREVAEVAAALNTMSDRIQQSIAAQTDFVANASHQLRTPLTGLRLRLEALAMTGAEGATAALAETDRLSRIITELLTLVRAGTDPERAETVDLDDLAQTAVDRWSVQAADSGHRIECSGLGQGARPVTASTNDVEIVLDNLVENALKYTPSGTVITISLHDEDDGVVLRVADDGPGIAAGDRERVFERFYRGNPQAPVAGTGLGLAIVRQIAQRWGGTAELSVGDGTSISVYLPAGDPVALQSEGSTEPERVPATR